MKRKEISESSFKPKALREAEKYFKNVHMTQEQHNIFVNIVKLFMQYIPMGEMAAKGLGWKSISKWQLEYKRDLLGLENEPPEMRIKSLEQLFEIVKTELTAILEDPEQQSLIDEAVTELLKFYKENYAYR
jgi:hypothetical protein